MRIIKVAIIGAGREGSSLYYCFRMKPNVQIVGIADVAGQGLGIDDAIKDGVVVSDSIEEIVTIEGLDVIVETTKNPEVAVKVHNLKRPDTQVLEASSLDLMITLGDKKEKMEAELFSLLGSVNDAILMADKNGCITYVNKAFEKLTGFNSQEVLGQSIFEKFADNPVTHSLMSGQNISGQKYSFGKMGKELSYNVTPIIVRGEVTGAIGVFRTTPDILKLMEELQRSTSVIEGLYERLGQINGLAELNISDVIPIDKMEQILLRQALTKYGYSVEGKKKAARALNISLATLYNKLKRYQIS